MANYLAHYTKKLQTLARKKLDLLRLLQREAGQEEVAVAAEAVREAQIRALEAKSAQVAPCEANARRLRAIEEEISACQRRSTAEIVTSCRDHPCKGAKK
jgi:hypothetical protein